MLRDMKADTHLKPGQKGTRKLLEQYGNRLLCVRYRYDEKRQVRMKTVEIIVDERPGTQHLRYREQDIVAVMVPYAEKAIRERLKAAGGGDGTRRKNSGWSGSAPSGATVNWQREY